MLLLLLALSCASISAVIKPDDIDVTNMSAEHLLTLADHQIAVDDLDGARKTLTKVLEAYPENEQAKEWLFYINNLRTVSELVEKIKLLEVIRVQNDFSDYVDVKSSIEKMIKSNTSDTYMSELLANADVTLKNMSWQVVEMTDNSMTFGVVAFGIGSRIKFVRIRDVEDKYASLIIECANGEPSVFIHNNALVKNKNHWTTLQIQVVGRDFPVTFSAMLLDDNKTLFVNDSRSFLEEFNGKSSILYKFRPSNSDVINSQFVVSGLNEKIASCY